MHSKTKDMTRGNPAKLILTFALPLMVGNVFQQLYTVVDAMVLGNALGVRALAAVGAVEWLTWVVVGIITGFAQGFTIPVAHAFGRADYQELRRAIANATLISAALAVLLTVVSVAIVRPVLALLGTPGEIVQDSRIYMTIFCLGALPTMAYNLQASILRALGNGRMPLISMIIAAATNIALDLLFVVGFGWGVAGAAIATVIAMCVSSIICFLALRGIDFLRFDKSEWKLNRPMAKQLLRLGLPMAFQNCIIAVGGIVVQTVINTFGMVFIAGFTATNKLYGLLELAATSFGFSMVTYTGQNLGARRYQRIRRGTFTGAIVGVATAVVISAAMLAFGRQIVGLFISDAPDVKARAVEVAYQYLSIMSYLLPVLYLLHIYRSALYGLGDTVIPMWSGIIEFAMRVAVILILPRIIGEFGVYFAEIAAWTGAAILLMVTYYYRERKLMALPEAPAADEV